MTDVLEVTVLDVSLDWVPGCEWGGWRRKEQWLSEPGCPQEAAWSGRATCCNRVRFYCDEHMVLRERAARDLSVAHRACGAAGAPMVWEPLRGK